MKDAYIQTACVLAKNGELCPFGLAAEEFVGYKSLRSLIWMTKSLI